MKLYNVLIKKNKSRKIEDIILVKEGFSFYAFFFNGFWFLYHKMWLEFLALIAIDLTLSFFADLDKLVLQFGFIIIVAANAHYWRVEHLKKKGYKLGNAFFGNDIEDAKLRLVKNFRRSEFDNFAIPKQNISKQKQKKPFKYSLA